MPLCSECVRLRKALERNERDWRALASHDMRVTSLPPTIILDAVLCALDLKQRAARELALHLNGDNCEL